MSDCWTLSQLNSQFGCLTAKDFVFTNPSFYGYGPLQTAFINNCTDTVCQILCSSFSILLFFTVHSAVYMMISGSFDADDATELDQWTTTVSTSMSLELHRVTSYT